MYGKNSKKRRKEEVREKDANEEEEEEIMKVVREGRGNEECKREEKVKRR